MSIDGAAFDFPARREPRYEGKAAAGHDKAYDGADAADFGGGLWRYSAGLSPSLVEQTSVDAARLGRHEWHRGERAPVPKLPRRPGRRWSDQDKRRRRVGAPDEHTVQGIAAKVEGNVDPPVMQALQEFRASSDLDANPKIGVNAPKVSERSGQNLGRNGFERADGDRSLSGKACEGHRLPRAIQRSQDVLRMRDQSFACRGCLKTKSRSQEKGRTEFALQGLDLIADGGLGEIEFACRPRDALATRDAEEGSEKARVHALFVHGIVRRRSIRWSGAGLFATEERYRFATFSRPI